MFSLLVYGDKMKEEFVVQPLTMEEVKKLQRNLELMAKEAEQFGKN